MGLRDSGTQGLRDSGTAERYRLKCNFKLTYLEFFKGSHCWFQVFGTATEKACLPILTLLLGQEFQQNIQHNLEILLLFGICFFMVW